MDRFQSGYLPTTALVAINWFNFNSVLSNIIIYFFLVHHRLHTSWLGLALVLVNKIEIFFKFARKLFSFCEIDKQFLKCKRFNLY